MRLGAIPRSVLVPVRGTRWDLAGRPREISQSPREVCFPVVRAVFCGERIRARPRASTPIRGFALPAEELEPLPRSSAPNHGPAAVVALSFDVVAGVR
jgi:hypothetical protein